MYNIQLPLFVNVEALRRNRNLLGEARMEDNGLTSFVSTGKYPPWNLGRCVRKEWESGIEKIMNTPTIQGGLQCQDSQDQQCWWIYTNVRNVK